MELKNWRQASCRVCGCVREPEPDGTGDRGADPAALWLSFFVFVCPQVLFKSSRSESPNAKQQAGPRAGASVYRVYTSPRTRHAVVDGDGAERSFWPSGP